MGLSEESDEEEGSLESGAAGGDGDPGVTQSGLEEFESGDEDEEFESGEDEDGEEEEEGSSE